MVISINFFNVVIKFSVFSPQKHYLENQKPCKTTVYILKSAFILGKLKKLHCPMVPLEINLTNWRV